MIGEDIVYFNHRGPITGKFYNLFRFLVARQHTANDQRESRSRRSSCSAPSPVEARRPTVCRPRITSRSMKSSYGPAQKHTVRFGINVPDISRRGLDDNTNRAGTYTFFIARRLRFANGRSRWCANPATATLYSSRRSWAASSRMNSKCAPTCNCPSACATTGRTISTTTTIWRRGLICVRARQGSQNRDPRRGRDVLRPHRSATDLRPDPV